MHWTAVHIGAHAYASHHDPCPLSSNMRVRIYVGSWVVCIVKYTHDVMAHAAQENQSVLGAMAQERALLGAELRRRLRALG